MPSSQAFWIHKKPTASSGIIVLYGVIIATRFLLEYETFERLYQTIPFDIQNCKIRSLRPWMFLAKYRTTFWIVSIFLHDSVDDSEAPDAEKCLDLQVVQISLNDLKVVNRTRCSDKLDVNCT